jgi:hypothetical protein
MRRMSNVISLAQRKQARCASCNKRVPHFGTERFVPCPDGADGPKTCHDVFVMLVLSRKLAQQLKKPWHAETQALFERSGLRLKDLDAEIERRDRVEADSREMLVGMQAGHLNALSDWIDGDEDRGLLLAKWALNQIDLTGGGTRNIMDMADVVERIDREMRDAVEDLENQDWEHGE